MIFNILKVIILVVSISYIFNMNYPFEKILVNNGNPLTYNGCSPKVANFFTKMTNKIGKFYW